MATAVGTSVRCEAQMPQLKRPEQNPQEKPPAPKKKAVKGPRALGLMQLIANKRTLIPVAILVDGKFYDASVYKAEPVPMALEPGTVYEAERGGESEGLFTINGALHSNNPGSGSRWIGTGSYLPGGAEAAKTTRKAEDVPVGLDSSGDEPPRLTRGNAAKGASAKDGTANAEKQPGDQGGTPTGKDKTTNPEAAGDSVGQSSSAQRTSDQKPVQETAKKSDAAGQPQSSENYYRPTLRRGKPTQPPPAEEDIAPTVSKADGITGAKATTGALEIIPAISDAGGPEARSYKFFWKEGEEEERRQQMTSLAVDEVRAYVAARKRGTIPLKALAATGSAVNRKPAAKVKELELENLQFHTFDIWVNNQPVMVLNAEAHVAGGREPLGVDTYSITLVARTDIYGNLRKLYSGVTDKYHLDVTPRMELIDAVDADGDGRGELLFRETTDAGGGYVIYRATADKLWKLFDSLGEGR